MDLTNDILRFSSALQEQKEDPLKDGLKFWTVDEALSPPDYNDIESTTTVDGVDTVNTYKSTSKRDLGDEVEPETPRSQDTISAKNLVEGWPDQRGALDLELERLSMWKFDVQHQGVDANFDDHGNPLHTIIRRSLVNISQVLVGLLKTEFTSPQSQLGEAHKQLRHKLDQYQVLTRSKPLDEDDRPYHQTRSRQSSLGASSEDMDVLGVLRDNIDMLGHVLSGLLVKSNAQTSLGKRVRRKSSMEGGEDRIDRKKLYNGPQSLPQSPEELKDNLCALDRSISDIGCLWGLVDIQRRQGTFSKSIIAKFTLSDQIGEVSTMLDFALGCDSSIPKLRSASHVALRELGLITADKARLDNEPVAHFRETVDHRSDRGLRDMATVVPTVEILRQLPAWRIQVSTEASSLVGPAVTALWLLLLEELLVFLRHTLQHLVEFNTIPTFYPDDEELTHLQRLFEEYSECQTGLRLESLVAGRRSRSGSLKKVHQSISSAIRSLCGHPGQLIETMAWPPSEGECGHVITTDFNTGNSEPSSVETPHIKPSFSSTIQCFTVRIAGDSHSRDLCQKGLDDFLVQPLL